MLAQEETPVREQQWRTQLNFGTSILASVYKNMKAVLCFKESLLSQLI